MSREIPESNLTITVPAAYPATLPLLFQSFHPLFQAYSEAAVLNYVLPLFRKYHGFLHTRLKM